MSDLRKKYNALRREHKNLKEKFDNVHKEAYKQILEEEEINQHYVDKYLVNQDDLLHEIEYLHDTKLDFKVDTIARESVIENLQTLVNRLGIFGVEALLEKEVEKTFA